MSAIFRSTGMVLSLMGLLVLGGCGGAERTGSSGPQDSSAVSQGATQSTPVDENGSDWMFIKALWVTRKGNLTLHAQPDLKSAEIATLPKNALLIHGGEREGIHSTIMTMGKSYTGDWIKVKSLDPDAIGWLFAGSLQGDLLAEEVGSEEVMAQATAAGRFIAPITGYSNFEAAQSLELKRLEPFDEGYSGYYQYLKDEEGVLTMDGRFWVGSVRPEGDGEERVTVYGEYVGGKAKEPIVATYTSTRGKETIWLDFDREGNFEGRRYTLESEGKVITKYSDRENSLDRETVVMD